MYESNESPRECAGSVEMTIVRAPASAQRRAVAAATDVLPTPPLPVNRSTRNVTRLRDQALDAGLEIIECCPEDFRLGAALLETRYWDDQIHREFIGDIGGIWFGRRGL